MDWHKEQMSESIASRATERTQTQLDQLSGKVDQLSENVDIAFQTITLLSNNTDRTLASINASIQRQDRILITCCVTGMATAMGHSRDSSCA